MMLQADEITNLIAGLGIVLCLIYGVAYMVEHSQSLRHQIRNLRPCKQVRAKVTRTKI